MPTVDRQRLLAWALYGGGTALLVGNLYLYRYFFHDDAFISLRYAANLLAHGDLSWNPGDRVEGYTNFLHLICVAGAMALGLAPTVAAQVVNGLAATGLVAALLVGARTLAPAQPVARAAGAAAVLLSTSLAAWIAGGLETVMASALLAGALALLLPLFGAAPPPGQARAGVAAVLFALAYLTRPDALLTNAVAGLCLLGFGTAPWRHRLVDVALLAAIPAATLAAHVAWRQGYYGEWLPNTYDAKVGVPLDVRLALVPRYMIAAVLVHMPTIAVGLAAAGALVLRRRLPRAALLLLAWMLAHAVYVAWSGGDHMPAGRLMLPLLVPAAWLLTMALATLHVRPRQVVAVGVVGLLVAALLLPGARRTDDAADTGRAIGRYIADAWPAGAVVALHTAGSIPFLAPDKVYVDMLGLNDRHIGKRRDVPLLAPYQANPGHSKGDGAYVLARRPDYIIAGPAEGAPVERPYFLSDVELAGLDEFRRCYALRVVPLPFELPPTARRRDFTSPMPFTYYERIC